MLLVSGKIISQTCLTRYYSLGRVAIVAFLKPNFTILVLFLNLAYFCLYLKFEFPFEKFHRLGVHGRNNALC